MTTTRRRPRQWSRDLVLKELKRLSREGVPLTTDGLQRNGHGSLFKAVKKYVGNLYRARALAGVPQPLRAVERFEIWDKDRVIRVIRQRARNRESIARTKVPLKLLRAARWHCGTWAAAVEMAGFDYASVRLQPYTRRTKRQTLDELQQLASDHPEWTFVNLYRHGIYGAVRLYFGSLKAALAAARLKDWPKQGRWRWSRAAILNAIRQRRAVGLSLAGRNVSGLARAARHYFGSWHAALRAASVPEHELPKRGKPPQELRTRAEIIAAVRKYLTHDVPVGRQIKTQDRGLYEDVLACFGGWQAAVEAARLEGKAGQADRRPRRPSR